MRRYICVLLPIVLSAVVAHGQGIAARSTAESLRGLHGVHVVVEEVIPEVRAAGLTAASVKSAVEDYLIKRGVGILGLGELAMNPRGPALLIRLDFVAADPVYFYSSQVQFFQNVTVDVGNGEVPVIASASTWQTIKVDKAGKFRLPTLPQEVVKQVGAFAEAYLKMNEPIMEMSADSTAVDGEDMEDPGDRDPGPDMEQ